MKLINAILLSAAYLTIAGLTSCDDGNVYLVSPEGELEIVASINDNTRSRVSHEDNEATLMTKWVEGDTIGLISADGSIANVPLVALGSGATTTFIPADGETINIPHNAEIYAYYPYNKSNPGNLTVAIAPGVVKSSYWSDSKYVSTEKGRPVARFEDSQDVPDLYDFLYCKAEISGDKVMLHFEHALSFLKMKFHPTDLIENGSLALQIASRFWVSTDNRYVNPDGSENIETDLVVDSIRLDNSEIRVGWSGITRCGFDLDKIGLSEMKKAAEQDKALFVYFPVVPKSFGVDNGRLEFYSNRGRDENGKNYTDKLLGIFNVPENGLTGGCVYSGETEKGYSDKVLSRQRAALEALYHATDGDHWTHNDGWLTDAPLCEWYGVQINANHSAHATDDTHDDEYVTGFYLSGNNLKGSLPPELGDLSLLSYADFEGNQFKNISSLEWLLKLDHTLRIKLKGCGIEGELKDLLPVLKLENPKMRKMDLSYHPFYNKKYDWVLSPQLEIDLSENKLTGSLPEVETAGIKIDLGFNELTGTIPASWATLCPDYTSADAPIFLYDDGGDQSYIQRFNVCHNHLSGDVPLEIQEKIPHSDYLFQDETSFNPFALKMMGSVTDIFGDEIDLYGEYQKNRYTVIISYAVNDISDDELFQIGRLASIYKSRSLGVITLPINYNRLDLPELPEEVKTIELEKSVVRSAFNLGNPVGIFQASSYLLIDNKGELVASHVDNCLDNQEKLQFPYRHLPRTELYDYIAALFGDDKFEPGVPDMYESSDYSEDGNVVALQKAALGRGVDLVLMGNGFVDTEIADGTYEQTMRDEMEALFSYEPYKTLRDRFNVYMVKAVSRNNVWINGSSHAMDDENDDENSLSSDKILDYAYKAPIKGVPQVGVVFNSTSGKDLGRSYTVMSRDNSFIGIILTPDTDVFVHEVGGHGLGKLADEYTEHTVDDDRLDEEIMMLREYWIENEWYLNVDYRNDPLQVNWRHFLADPRYDAENLGVYAGAYAKDGHFYRPSDNSMMNYNNSPFNAPSRELIYKRVMRESEGAEWKYDFETFYNLDRGNIAPSKPWWGAPAKRVKMSEKTRRPKVVRSMRNLKLPTVSE